MKISKLILIGTVAPMLAACGAGGVISRAPYADLYVASYAETGKTVENVLSGPGKTIEGAATGAKRYFGERDLVSEPIGKLILEKLIANGTSPASAETPVFKMTYNGVSVEFTEADFLGDEFDKYFEKVGLTSDDQERTIAYLYSVGSGLDEIGGKVMVPVGFGVRLKRDGTLGTAENASQFVNGFSIVGLETNPSAMPKDRTAQYSGGTRLNLRAKLETDGVGVDQISYRGDSEIAANFSTGKITGKVIINEQQVEDYDVSEIEKDLSENGVEVALTGDIISNGFALGLTPNAAANTTLADVGITDLKAEGAGRFYGTNAEAVGAIVTGSSKNFLLDGVIWGEANR